MFKNFFHYLEANQDTPKGKLINQIVPVTTCLVLLGLFMLASRSLIQFVINPNIPNPISFDLGLRDIVVGFFLYFVTAVDYALIVGRMQVVNHDPKSRFLMNVFTCLGCFFGVILVLLLWSFVKDNSWLVLPLLIFAGSVMLKLAYEGKEYFEKPGQIAPIIAKPTLFILRIFYLPTRIFTFWIPKLASPNVGKLSSFNLAKWSFLLPFVIGLDDLIGYMGAMTIYNVFGLLFGIFLADIIIDILIFISPELTKKIVQSAVLSVLAAYAFIYLAFQAFTEVVRLTGEKLAIPNSTIIFGLVLLILGTILVDLLKYRREHKVISR